MRLLLYLLTPVLLLGQIPSTLTQSPRPLPTLNCVFGTEFASNDPVSGLTFLDTCGGVTFHGGQPDGSSGEGIAVPSLVKGLGAQFAIDSFFGLPDGTLSSTTDMSVVVAYSTPSCTSSISLVTAYNSGSPFQGWGIACDGSGVNQHKLCFWNGTAWNCGTSSVDGGVQHISVITLSSSLLSFYLDGAADGSVSAVHTAAYSGTNSIGGALNAAKNSLSQNTNGLTISAFYLYNRVLTAAEIANASSVLLSYSGFRPRPKVPTRLQVPPVFPTVADNGLARTPSMGYNTWDFQNSVTEAQSKTQADAIVSSGLKAAGYTNFEISEWGNTRDGSGVMHADATRFPDDYAGMISYVHGDGLQIGMYTGMSYTTCAGFRGSLRHEIQDALQYATLGFDALYYDQCNIYVNDGEDYAEVTPTYYPNSDILQQQVRVMANALQATGRNILFRAFPYVPGDTPSWCRQAANSCYTVIANVHNWTDIINAIELQVGLGFVTSVGHWDDADFLLVGNGITDNQGVAQMSIEAVVSSTLFISSDVTSLSSTSLTTLKNVDALAIDQDALGYIGDRVSTTACGSSTCEVWAKQLSGTHSCAIAFFNQDSAPHNISITWSALNAAIAGCGTGPYTTTFNVWANWPSSCTSGATSGPLTGVSCKAALGTLSSGYTATVPATGAVLITVAP